ATPPPPGAAPSARTGLPGRPGGRRRGRYALEIAYESRGGAGAMARLVESTVLVNDAHPAWRRAEAARAEGYHVALCVAMALAPLAVVPEAAHEFIDAFMARWGEAAERKGRRSGIR
ncbi:MAG TPA: hypothetical protein VMM12_07910, partial [Longimicrobiales bacterium]|nr:hypothetical protein [Longimicrobiales bacterium]